MKIYLHLILSVTIYSNTVAQTKLESIKSQVAIPNDYQYATNLEELHNGEKWGFHSRLIGDLTASSCLESQQGVDYDIKNIGDLNLKTAWIEGESGYGKGEYFAFTVKFDPKVQYGSAGQFYGKIEVFNGYCKTQKIWEQNSRVKRLKVYLNSTPICIIELQDTWQYQSVFIGKFFKNLESRQYLDAKYELNEGDQLKFEIIDIYPGDKYKDVALSEFVAEGAPN